MAKTQKRGIGDLGEGIVCRYLENKGYVVVGRNYLRPWGEIDIVAKRGGVTHFVEVKTVTREQGRVGDHRGVSFRPEENMHEGKIKRLHRAIQTYMLEHRMNDDATWQMDLACVYISLEDKRARVEMLENIV